MMLRPGLAWDGQGWGIVWPDSRTGVRDVRYAHIAANGYTKETIDVVVSDGGVDAFGPRMAWTGSEHAIVWVDGRTANNQIYLRRVARDGTPVAASTAVTSGAGLWRRGVRRRRLGRRRRAGSGVERPARGQRGRGLPPPFVADRRAALRGAPSLGPGRARRRHFQLSLGRTATRWAVAVEDIRTGDLGPVEIRLTFADPATGAKLGADVLASSPLDAFVSDHPSLAWGGGTLAVAWHDASSAPMRSRSTCKR